MPLEYDRLNPLLFNGDRLKPEIRDKIIEIVQEFLKYAQSENLNVLDIRLLGSNAAYNYTTESDLDIHIVTDLSEVSDPEIIARLYFDSIKKNFKDVYDIRIKGIEVEIYVEDINSSAVSNGIYSIIKDRWINEPIPASYPTDEEIQSAKEKEYTIVQNIKSVTTVDELSTILDDIYLMRKDSLSSEGENGAGNLAFKSLRKKGILDKIKEILKGVTTKKLSLESLRIRESMPPLKTLKGSIIKRSSKYGVGKEIGGKIYLHKNYVDKVVNPDIYSIALKELNIKYPQFRFNCIMYGPKNPNIVRFDEAPDFDTSREPIPGKMIVYDLEANKFIERYSDQLWHHKWMWVMDDYKGFNVQESYEWSRLWLSRLTVPASGLNSKWENQLAEVGLK